MVGHFVIRVQVQVYESLKLIIDGDDQSEGWTNAVDRGGLTHVSHVTYMLFLSMETELRKHLNPSCASETSGVKGVATTAVKEDEDVLFYWSLISINWGEEEAEALLNFIVDHWITLRGFSFTSAFMEKYKQANKKPLQKTKALRKTLNSKDDTKNTD